MLSTDRNLNLIARAKKAGYFIECYYVLTADPELNLFRIKARVLNGGHNVPFDKVRERYYKSLERIPTLISHCDRICIIDNTKEPSIIYLKETNGHKVVSENKYWPKEKIISLVGENI